MAVQQNRFFFFLLPFVNSRMHLVAVAKDAVVIRLIINFFTEKITGVIIIDHHKDGSLLHMLFRKVHGQFCGTYIDQVCE
jgi:hypothetical protein